MTYSDIYPYAEGNLLLHRNTYFYSKCYGAAFLRAWREQRNSTLNRPLSGQAFTTGITPTLKLITSVLNDLKSETVTSQTVDTLHKLVQRFEVTKRVHDQYLTTWRAADPSKFHCLQSYVALAEAFCLAYERSNSLIYLNTLLKLNDTLSPYSGSLNDTQRERVAGQIEREAEFVSKIQTSLKTSNRPVIKDLARVSASVKYETVLLACDSTRARAYLQAMCRTGCPPHSVYLMGPETLSTQPDDSRPDIWKGIYLPDLSKPISVICANAGIAIKHLPERDVNCEATLKVLAKSMADIVVYAGVGGQIVSEAALRAGPRFLHMHSGWLPQYRGSTTLYYALLNNDPIGVSSIFLDPGIDTGPIVHRQSYPAPDAKMDLDLDYDAVIRADALCRTLTTLSEDQNSKGQISQTPDEGETYFVIHPVLKHVALLSLDEENR